MDAMWCGSPKRNHKADRYWAHYLALYLIVTLVRSLFRVVFDCYIFFAPSCPVFDCYIGLLVV